VALVAALASTLHASNERAQQRAEPVADDRAEF
jgi:hypothetical protein